MRKFSAAVMVCALTTAFVVTPVIGSSADPTAAEVTVQTLDVDGVSKRALADSSALESPQAISQNRVEEPPSAKMPDMRATNPTDAPLPELDRKARDSSEMIGEEHLAVLSQPKETKHFVLAGITWSSNVSTDVLSADARILEDGVWSSWETLDILPTQPGDKRTGTEPLITNGANGIQVRVLTTSGAEPDGLEVSLVDPGESGKDIVDAPESNVPSFAGAAGSDGLKPNVIAREKWMGDGQEKYTTWKSDYSARLDAMYLHHTAGSNSYGVNDGAGIVRAIYSYHARTLGWGDIGYQFLVDKFGNVFEGRHDAMESLPIGAQAGGYNSGTIGVSAIGNYETAEPTPELLDAITQVFAWKAYENGLNPTGTTKLLTGTSSKSSLKNPIGSWVTVPTILGHRDTNATACPGKNLYNEMSQIRATVQAKIDAYVDGTGSYRPSLSSPSLHSVPASVYPVLLSETVKLSWNEVPGATRYHVLTRLSNKGYALGRDISWTLHKNVTTNSATLTFKEGQTRYIALRAVNAQGHSLPVKIAQITRPTHANSATKSSGWKKVSNSGYYGGSALQASSAEKALDFGSASATRKISIVGESGPSAGKIDVLLAGKKVGTVDFASTTVNRRVVKTIDLKSARSGKIQLKTIGSAAKWTVSGVALLPEEQSAPKLPTPVAASNVRAPATPKVSTLSSSVTPATLKSKTKFTWKKAAGAVSYEFGVKEAAYNKSMPSKIAVKRTVQEASIDYSVRAGFTTKAYVRAVGANGRKSSWASFKTVGYPPTGDRLKRSKGWQKQKSSKYFRGYAYQTSRKGATIKISKAKSIKRVAITVSKSSGSGRIAVYAGSKKVKTLNLKAKKQTYTSRMYVTLPKTYSGTITLKTLDSKVVRVSAVTLIK